MHQLVNTNKGSFPTNLYHVSMAKPFCYDLAKTAKSIFIFFSIFFSFIFLSMDMQDKSDS